MACSSPRSPLFLCRVSASFLESSTVRALQFPSLEFSKGARLGRSFLRLVSSSLDFGPCVLLWRVLFFFPWVSPDLTFFPQTTIRFFPTWPFRWWGWSLAKGSIQKNNPSFHISLAFPCCLFSGKIRYLCICCISRYSTQSFWESSIGFCDAPLRARVGSAF